MLRQIFNRTVIRSSVYLHSKNVWSRNVAVRALSSQNELIKIKVNSGNDTIELHDTEQSSTGSQKKLYEFPFVWLRDNCQCDVCYHAQSSSRTINWETFDVSIKPKEVQFDDRKILKITWSDNEAHISEFSYDWLMERNFSQHNRDRYLNTMYRPTNRLWAKSDWNQILQYFDFHKIIDDDQELYNWLQCLTVNGVAIIKNTPSTELEARNIANRVGFIRRTHYGEEFMVKAKEGTSNVAYLPTPLQIHTDLPYYHYAPGCNLLHCLVQSKSSGAQNLLTDGFYVATLMKDKFPKEFKLLSTVLVNWVDIGKDDEDGKGPPFHSIYRAPMFCLDYEGNLERINHSIPQRDSFFSVPVEVVSDWYKSLAKFVELIHEEAVEFKTEEGTILCFNNIRLVHGRKKYEDSLTNSRHLVGAYLDWDEIYSRLRVLRKTLEKNT